MSKGVVSMAGTLVAGAMASPALGAVTLLERGSAAVVQGMVETQNVSGTFHTVPIPAPGISPGETLYESVEDANAPTFGGFASGSVMRSGSIAQVTSPPNQQRPGVSASGSVNMSDGRILNSDGATAGFGMNGTASVGAGITLSNPSFGGSARGHVHVDASSTWTFTVDVPTRYYFRGSAAFASYLPPTTESSGTVAGYSLMTVDAESGSWTGILDSTSSSSLDLTPIFNDDGELLPGTYAVQLSGAAGGGVSRTAGGTPSPSFSTSITFGLNFSLAAAAAPAVTVGVAEHADYAGIAATPSEGPTSAAIIGGSASGNRTVELAVLTEESDDEIVGHLVELTGTAGDLVVLQLSYDDALVTGDEAELRLGWLNELGQWVNAIDGNSDSGASSTFVVGAYDSGLHFALGTWGVDTVGNTVWAVIDHNSTFGVNVVPEPASLAVLAGLGIAMLRPRRR